MGGIQVSSSERGLNRGKDFENVIRKCFERVPETAVERLQDPTNGFVGVGNKSDFIVYHYPYQYYIECKTIQEHRFPLRNLTFHQRTGMLSVSDTKGVVAGVICWYIPDDITIFMPIQIIEQYWQEGRKSIHVANDWHNDFIILKERKKRIFFDYDMADFFKTCEARGLGTKIYNI